MTTQDGQVKWKIKDMRTHHMCGEIVALVTTPPDYEHLLLCDGQTINADDYPELVAALGSNVLPNLNGVYCKVRKRRESIRRRACRILAAVLDIAEWAYMVRRHVKVLFHHI